MLLMLPIVVTGEQFGFAHPYPRKLWEVDVGVDVNVDEQCQVL